MGDTHFTPLESPSIYAGDGENTCKSNKEHQLLIEGGVKALPFLTGFILSKKNRTVLFTETFPIKR